MKVFFYNCFISFNANPIPVRLQSKLQRVNSVTFCLRDFKMSQIKSYCINMLLLYFKPYRYWICFNRDIIKTVISVFLDSKKLKIVWKKITAFLKRCISIIQ